MPKESLKMGVLGVAGGGEIVDLGASQAGVFDLMRPKGPKKRGRASRRPPHGLSTHSFYFLQATFLDRTETSAVKLALSSSEPCVNKHPGAVFISAATSDTGAQEPALRTAPRHAATAKQSTDPPISSKQHVSSATRIYPPLFCELFRAGSTVPAPRPYVDIDGNNKDRITHVATRAAPPPSVPRDSRLGTRFAPTSSPCAPSTATACIACASARRPSSPPRAISLAYFWSPN